MHLRDSTLAERKLHTVIGENARRKPRDLYDAGWLVHERPELISNESAKKLKEWMAGLTPERKASMRQAMQKERVIRRCDVDVVWRLLENGIKDLKIERDSGRTSPGISNDGPGAAQEPKTAGGTSSNTPAQARTSAKDSVSGSPLRAALVCGVHLLRSGLSLKTIRDRLSARIPLSCETSSWQPQVPTSGCSWGGFPVTATLLLLSGVRACIRARVGRGHGSGSLTYAGLCWSWIGRGARPLPRATRPTSCRSAVLAVRVPRVGSRASARGSVVGGCRR